MSDSLIHSILSAGAPDAADLQAVAVLFVLLPAV